MTFCLLASGVQGGGHDGFAEFLVDVLSEVRMDSGELSLVLDFSDADQARLVDLLFGLGVPANLFDPEGLSRRQRELPSPCPIFVPWTNMSREEREASLAVPPGELYSPEEHVIPRRKSCSKILVWSKETSLENILKAFEGTVQNCKQKWNLGVFHRAAKLVFVTESANGTEAVFGSAPVTRHERAAVLRRTGGGKVQFWSYNFYHETNGGARLSLNGVWRPGAPVSATPDTGVFTRQRTFGGRRFRAVIIPYAHMTRAAYRDDEAPPNQLLRDHWGVNMEILDAMKDKLDFRISLYNPTPVYSYGTTDLTTGEWDGGVGMVKRGECDFMIEYTGTYESVQVGDLAFINLQDYETFASPRPFPKLKVLAILSPFSPLIWALVAVSMLTFPPSLRVISKTELGTGQESKTSWTSSILELAWFCFATIVGESITRQLDLNQTRAMR